MISEIIYKTPPIIQEISPGLKVVRDDLLEGGSKMRFLPYLIGNAKEVVYGSPFCGGAAVSLSVIGKYSGIRVSLFYAQRREPHQRQILVRSNGAFIHWIPYGYMTNVQSKAKAYAYEQGALFLPLGFDVPEAEEPFVEAMEGVRKRIGSPGEVWCTTGSGMLARCLGRAFQDSKVIGVSVGLKSRSERQLFTSNVEIIESKYKFETAIHKVRAPFPSCPNYDRKGWELCANYSRKRESTLFWNVLGD